MNPRIRGAKRPITAGLAVAVAIGMLAAGPTAFAASPATVGLGTAGAFGVLAGTTVTNTGATTINGNLGVSPGSAITGAPTVIGTIHAADAVALQAQNDLTTAYVDAAGRPVTNTYTELAGLTLVAGVYGVSAATCAKKARPPGRAFSPRSTTEGMTGDRSFDRECGLRAPRRHYGP